MQIIQLGIQLSILSKRVIEKQDSKLYAKAVSPNQTAIALPSQKLELTIKNNR